MLMDLFHKIDRSSNIAHNVIPTRVVVEQSKVDSLESELVKKRPIMGKVMYRARKAKSLFMPSDLLKKPDLLEIDSFTRSRRQVLREGAVSRTKITEEGKKVRKRWGLVYAASTESRLSLYKDHQAFQIRSKTEVEIELEGVTVEWTQVKSSRKNVFQVNTSSSDFLFQVDDLELAINWFNDVKLLTGKNDGVFNNDTLRSNGNIVSAGEEPKKKPSRFKLSSTDEQTLAQVKEFFSRMLSKKESSVSQ